MSSNRVKRWKASPSLYGMTVDDLKARNHLTDAASFYVGQLLDVSASVPNSVPTNAPADAPTQVADASSVSAPSTPDDVVVHTVARGETMFRIANQYGVTVNAIAQANQIADPTLIYAGQELIIPGVEPPKIAAECRLWCRALTLCP